MTNDYWLMRCGCGLGHTNIECVTQAAVDTGTPLEEAMKLFRRPESETIPTTKWSQGDPHA